MTDERVMDNSDCENNIDATVGSGELCEEDSTQLVDDNMQLSADKHNKRPREENTEEIWQTVTRNSKKKTRNPESQSECFPIQICVTSKEKLPKQFALAKLLQQHNITEVTKVKYVNPYKILINFGSETSAEKFLKCSEFDVMGWRKQKTWEVGLSYGIIRDIDIDLSDEELLKYIIADKEVLIIKRLNRKTEQGWTPSETVRIGFKGSSLPSHIYLIDIKIKVEPFVFPVTQCAKCWRFGHTVKMCPSNKIICPKCGKNHNNCEVKVFKCVNCSGGHMALSKNCPMYKKEKRIRELMSEFNCTYQKALTVYVPPSPQHRSPEFEIPTTHCAEDYTAQRPVNDSTPSYSDITQRNVQPTVEVTTATIEQQNTRRKKKHKHKKPYYISENVVADIEVSVSEINSDNSHDDESPHTISDAMNCDPPITECQNEDFTFKVLLQKLKEITLEKRHGLLTKLKECFYMCIEWLSNLFKNLIPDFSSLKKFFSFLNG